MLKKFKELRKNKKGFTLIELVVVLVIIAILAAITVPVVTGYIEDANNARYISEAQAVYMIIQTEEAKVAAKEETKPENFYETLVTTANTKLRSTLTEGVFVGTITPPTGDVDTYTVAFKSDGKDKEAVIDPNNEISIK